MSTARHIVDQRTRENQRRASDPEAVVFVSAIAGSGKTYVLTQRVKRLLLQGVRPERILCLTFTKAAAANMSNRLLADLGDWVGMSDEALRTSLGALQDQAADNISARMLQDARGLFAKAIETPGGLKIQTIHAFCDALLHQFPFEAGVPANFRELDGASEAEFLTAAAGRVMAAALAEPSSLVGAALRDITLLANEDRFTAQVKKAASFRSVIDDMLPSLDDAPALAKRLRRVLEIADDLTIEAIDDALLSQAALAPAEWPAAIAEIRALENQASDKEKFSDRLQAALEAGDQRQRARAYGAVFLTADGKPRSASRLVPAKLLKVAPELHALLQSELTRISALIAQRWGLEICQISLALTILARAVIDDIERSKAREAFLGFDDLIAAANRLLDGRAGDWVRWKLDQGIEHILIDEAQDTSTEQWRLVRRLSEEFFAGKGANENKRTLFVVGDDKQSIFSFQGAAPALFDSERLRIASKATQAGLDFRNVVLDLSFRSTEPVLDAVATVFSDLQRLKGVTSDSQFPDHRCAREGVPGRVDIWPLAPPPADSNKLNGWDYPFLVQDIVDPEQDLANRLARHIASAIGHDQVDDHGRLRPLAAGDVLILVRRRKAFFDKMIRALKQQGVPVAGADRLKLVEHIAVMDLLALGDAVLLPDDDLTFACLLKSPLLGLDEDDLFRLANGRGDHTLADELARRAGEETHWQTAHRRFVAWRERAGAERPYDFFAGVLGRDGGRRDFMGRLGSEANDALSEFLAAALDFETRHIPSLQGFLAWMRSTESVVKREMEQGRDEVRVMTIHNAKGLQAKYVIMPETVQVPRRLSEERLVEACDPLDGKPLLLWLGKAGQEPDLVARARAAGDQAALAEYYRLLYVAMTRAEDRLLIAGYRKGTKEAPATSWYALIDDQLRPLCTGEADATGDIVSWRYPATALAADTPATIRPAVAAKAMIPDWLQRPAPPSPAGRRLSAPSRFGGGTAGASVYPVIEEGLTAQLRGQVLHQLLQRLPQLPPGRRHEAAQTYARRQLGSAAAGVADEALGVLAMPELATLLAGPHLAEVPVIGTVEVAPRLSLALSGRIDLLAVGAEYIDIIDFKSGEAPSDEPPQAYIIQLALYARLLSSRYRDHATRVALVWTRLPRYDVVSSERMAGALATIEGG